MQSPVKIWRNQIKIQKLLGLEGKVISWTRIHVPPEGFESQAPYIVVIVKLKNGQNYTAQLVNFNHESEVLGLTVKAVLRRTRDPGEEGVIPYGIKFRPV